MAKTTKPSPRTAVVGCLGAFVILSLLVGLALIGVSRMRGGDGNDPAPASPSQPNSATSAATSSNEEARKDAIANRPMLYNGEKWEVQTEVAATTPPLQLPTSTRKVNGLINSGFPRTPAGAVAQLAALNTTVYRDLDRDRGREVYTAFAQPGAVDMNDWDPTSTVQEFWTKNTDLNPTSLHATYTPVQGLVKGVADNGNWVLACVLGRLVYEYNDSTTQIGIPNCARMQWDPTRQQWMLAAGADPAKGTITWPRSAVSYKAGYRDLTGGGANR